MILISDHTLKVMPDCTDRYGQRTAETLELCRLTKKQR